MSVPPHRLRVAYVLPWLTVGGTEIATLRLATAARRAGHDGMFFFPASSGAAVDLVRSGGFETDAYAGAEPRKRHPLPFVVATLRLAAALRARRIDVVHCVDSLGARWGAVAGRLAGGVVIGHVLLAQKSLSSLDRALLRPVEHWLFAAQRVWDSFAISVPAARGRVLYDGYSSPIASRDVTRESARRRFGMPSDAFVFGMAARVAPQKDHETLIRAAAVVKARVSRCRLLIAGDHRDDPQNRAHYESLRPLLRETGTEDIFTFAGRQPEMQSFFAAIDGFVLSTHWEGLPLAVLEAMAHAKPIVATAVDGIPEAIRDDVSGLLVPPRSPDRLAAAMIRLIEEPQAAARLVAAASETHGAQFSAAAYEERVARLYERISGRRPT